MKQMYFDLDEKMSFMEKFIYNHELDEDELLIKRSGFSYEFVNLSCLLGILILAVICF